VAVKVVRLDTPASASCFLREVEALASVRHPNVLPFLGAALAPPGATWVVSEFMPGGSLRAWLHGGGGCGGAVASPPQRRPLAARLRMAVGVARGMAALSGADPPLLHRDLKPSNILIDGAGQPRVADFGLARWLAPGDAASLTGETGTYQYMAPEVFRHEGYGPPADVWSYGCVLAEIMGQALPYADALLTPVQVATAVAADKLRPSLPAGCDAPPAVASIIAACTDPEPSLRPAFTEVATALGRVAAEVAAASVGASTPVLAGGVLTRFWGGGKKSSTAEEAG
jgi:serine/threonine-protein kinase TNNI3K